MSNIGHLMVSNIRHFQYHNSLLETKRHRLVIVNFPDPFCGIPSAASPFDTTLRLGVLEFNPQSNNFWLLRWRPAGFFYCAAACHCDSERRPIGRRNVQGTSLRLFDRRAMFAEFAKASLLNVGETATD
jgi:hypothetical protein